MADYPLLNEASLVMIPGATKEGKVYSQVPTDGSGDFTFTRSTTATRVNEAGNIEKGYENLRLHSNQFDTTWIKKRVSVTSGQSGYNGSNDAWVLENNEETGQAYLRGPQNLSGVKTFSIYAKHGTASHLRLNEITSGASVFFDLINGVVSDEEDNVSSYIESIGNDWYRCSSVINSSTTGEFRIQISQGGSGTSSIGDNIYIQDAQLNQGLVAYPYLETTTAPVYGGLQSDQPRLDYTDATCPSLLLEPSRTNLFPYSEYIANYSPAFGGVVEYDSTIQTPQGVNGCYTFHNSDGGAYARIRHAAGGFTLNDKITASVFVKGTPNSQMYLGGEYANESCIFNLQTKTLATQQSNVESYKIEDYGNGWTRYSVVLIFGNAQGNGIEYSQIRVSGDSSNKVPLWGWQLEEGSYPSSYIPTYGSTQTRAAETTTSTFNSSSTGTISVSLGKVSEDYFTVLGESFDANATRNDIAIAYSPTALKVSLNGAIVVNATGTYDTSSLSSLQLGHDNGSDQLGGGVENLIMFNDFLTDTELNAITV